VAYLLAALAAFVNALVSVLQRLGVETAPESTTLRLSLMAHAIRRGVWLLGFALSLVQFAILATALRFGELSVVQPILTTELLFLLLILAAWFRYRLGVQEWLGSAIIVVGLGGFFLAASPKGGQAIPDNHQWVVAYLVLIAGITVFIAAALRGPRWWRAAAFGAATAITAAFSAALTKATTNYITQGWGHVFDHAQPYLLAVTGLGTVFLLQNALHAGPITASRTTLVTLNPLVSILLGITLFADRLRTGPLWVSLEIAALTVLVVGVVILARSPLVAGTNAEGIPGEMLAGARQRGTEVTASGNSPTETTDTTDTGGPPSVDPVPLVGEGSAG
jgi:drug/metabolite transporter (DMT)-like permease